MLSDVKNVVSTLFTHKHAPAKSSEPLSVAHPEKQADHEAPTGRRYTYAAPKPTPIQPSTEEENQAASRGIPIRGISSRGSGQGMIYASPDGRISMHAEPTAEPITRISPPHSPPASPRKASEPPVEAPVESESHPTPSSPTAKHTKVPLKDKVMGEFKIISGKVSRDGTKVEEGIALKTGHGHPEPVETERH
ncbi:collagen alpha-1(VII) chain [Rhizoctonia solani]|uniref:Collagen alpha-1(VII) chain n=1 Tax=Rhizoctonia solani TaxID=456999 RepID=A0A8H8P8Y2_9AGAM|nr:collagen alpha-1(VII) chain [Rhizoctonia solani]QRW26497.1 collagen alpha-1(VII) chain [Rhizoctonia solani]